MAQAELSRDGRLKPPGRLGFVDFDAVFWSRVHQRSDDECWPWGATISRGYGRIQHHGRVLLAHRVAYEMLVGPIPAGLTLDHLCRNRACVNPAHLEPVTRGENVLRGIGSPAQNARKTHCKRGHLLPTTRSWGGRRVCRMCCRLRRRRTSK